MGILAVTVGYFVVDRSGLYGLMDVGEIGLGKKRKVHVSSQEEVCLALDAVYEISIYLRRKGTWMLNLERVLYFEEQCPRRAGNGTYLRATAS